MVFIYLRVELSSLGKLPLHYRNHLLIISLTSLQNSIECSNQMWSTCNSVYLYRYPSSLKLSCIRLSFIAQRIQFRRRHQRRGQVLEVRRENGRYLPILTKLASHLQSSHVRTYLVRLRRSRNS